MTHTLITATAFLAAALFLSGGCADDARATSAQGTPMPRATHPPVPDPLYVEKEDARSSLGFGYRFQEPLLPPREDAGAEDGSVAVAPAKPGAPCAAVLELTAANNTAFAPSLFGQVQTVSLLPGDGSAPLATATLGKDLAFVQTDKSAFWQDRGMVFTRTGHLRLALKKSTMQALFAAPGREWLAVAYDDRKRVVSVQTITGYIDASSMYVDGAIVSYDQDKAYQPQDNWTYWRFDGRLAHDQTVADADIPKQDQPAQGLLPRHQRRARQVLELTCTLPELCASTSPLGSIAKIYCFSSPLTELRAVVSSADALIYTTHMSRTERGGVAVDYRCERLRVALPAALATWCADHAGGTISVVAVDASGRTVTCEVLSL